jgi:hypothetical protein
MPSLQKLLIPLALFGVLNLFPLTASARPRQIEASAAQGKRGALLTVEVFPGSGIPISFISMGEKIVNVWLDDPNRFAPSFDRPMCTGLEQSGRPQSTPGGQSGQCESPEIIYLRRSRAKAFPGVPNNPNGKTLLTIVTEKNGRKQIYQFHLLARLAGIPRNTSLEVVPDGKGDDAIPTMPIPRIPTMVTPTRQAK